jgi:hypothetical protein
MWYRIFCKSEQTQPITGLLAHFQALGMFVQSHVRGDDLGWTSAELRVGVGSPVMLERFLVKEDDLRGELNNWAAWLETATWSENSPALMEHVIQTQQMITLRKPIDHSDEIALENLCQATVQFFAQARDGIYQIDDDGWYSATGTLLVKEY